MTVSILRETPITAREAIIPYLMAGLNMLAATLFAYQLLTPRVLLVVLALTLLGLPCSIYFRQRGHNRIRLNLLMMIPLFILTWVLVRDLPGMRIDWSHPFESAMQQSMTDELVALLHIIVIITAGRALILITPRDLLQTPIPSVIIVLLAAITPLQARPTGSDPFALSCLFVVLATSLYLFSQAHTQNWFARHIPVRIQRRLILWILGFTVLSFPVVALVSYATQPFNMIRMSRINARRHLPSLRLPSFLRGNAGISLDNHIEMGGAQWPQGKQVIMTVLLDKPSDLLWRASSYAFYHNGSWYPYRRHGVLIEPLMSPMATVTLHPDTMPTGDPGIAQALREHKLSLTDPADPNYCLVTQRFAMKARVIGREMPIYGAFQMNTFETEQMTYRQIHWESDSSSFISTNDMPDYGISSYSVDSIVKPLPTRLQLTADPQLPVEEQFAYLALPDESYRRVVREKALAILREAHLTPTSDPFRIVRQFETYLGKNYRYTLRPSSPKNHTDPILDFLLTQKKGYCNYFSGAMVMLCRSVDIPARFVVGFATGEEKKTDAGSLYTVTASEAHSWVEVYLPHYGWYTSDPTAGSTEVASVLGETWDFLSNMFTILKETIRGWIAALWQNTGYLYLGLVGLLVLTAGVVYLRRDGPPRLPRRELSTAEAQAEILRAYHRMLRWLRAWGVMKPDGVTAQEFAQLVAPVNAVLGETVTELTTLYITAQYGAVPVDDTDARHAILLLQQLWEQGRTERGRLRNPSARESAE